MVLPHQRLLADRDAEGPVARRRGGRGGRVLGICIAEGDVNPGGSHVGREVERVRRAGAAEGEREIDPPRGVADVARECRAEGRGAERHADRVVGVRHRRSARRRHEGDPEDGAGGGAAVGEVDVPDGVQRDGR